MKNILRGMRSLGLCMVAAAPVAYAQAPAPADQPTIVKVWHGDYDVDREGRVTETVTHSYQVFQEKLLEGSKVYAISFSSSIQTGEFLEAYTLKKDGSRVPAPASNYQTQTNNGRGNAGPAFSDRTRLSVVLPDFTAGDTVHVRYRIAEKQPMFPGQFSLAMPFSPFVAYEDVRMTVRLPADMKVQGESHFLQALPETQAEGRRTMAWRWSNPKPRRYDEELDQGLWSTDETPSVFVSTFPSYEAIAAAYGERALPKARPTARIQALAAQVVGAEERPRERARLLYEWVSRNITYGGNCIGVGAVVPRDLDVVVDNKMGDCKDHATLLQALWAAAGIRSEQVLVNAGSNYDLAKTPVVSMVNHVINYLPELGLYVDATAKEIPFGYLPMSAYAKPVIHVGRARAVERIPDARPGDNAQTLRMAMKVAGNGSATGKVSVSLKGTRAAEVRAYMREMSADAEREFVKRLMASQGLRGRGTLERGATGGLSDSYAFSMAFEVDNFMQRSSGTLPLGAPLSTPLPVSAFADMDNRVPATRRTPCYGFTSDETLDIELPAGLVLLNVPKDLHVRQPLVDYDARYQQDGQRLVVERSLKDKTATSVCSAQAQNDLVKQAAAIGDNLQTQVLYSRSPR